MATIEVSASVATETYTGVDGGLDVDVTVTIDGVDIDGEVTLTPHADGRPGYGAYGMDPGHWISGDLLAALSNLPANDFIVALGLIEGAAADSCAAR